MYNAPYMGVANNLAGYGRYGDSMLVHMNPAEVQMLSRMSPTGQLTRNPVTGQPEAFLPFLAPLLGSLAGSSLLTGVGAGGILGAAGLSSAAAGAIGSALGTTLATGDLEQGIMSGITGYGLGGALGKVASLGNKAAQSAAADLATQQSAQKILDTSTAEALSKAQAQEAASIAATKGSMASDTLPSAGLESVTKATQDPTYLAALQAQKTGAADVAASQQALTAAQRNIPASEIAMGPFRRPGAFFSELAQPSTYLPAYVGESARMQRQMEEEGQMSAKRFAEQQEGERARARGQIGSVYSALSSAYPGVRYANGGFVVPQSNEPEFINRGRGLAIPNPNYTTPASSNAEIDKFAASMGMQIPTDVQLSLRGQYALTPPTASYSALDVGGEGYLPGIAPEFQYFTDINPNATSSGGTGYGTGYGTGGTGYGTGGTDDGIEPDLTNRGPGYGTNYGTGGTGYGTGGTDYGTSGTDYGTGSTDYGIDIDGTVYRTGGTDYGTGNYSQKNPIDYGIDVIDYGTGVTDYGTGSTDYGTGGTDYVTGGADYGTGGTDYGTGGTSYGTGNTNYGTGVTGSGTISSDYGTGGTNSVRKDTGDGIELGIEPDFINRGRGLAVPNPNYTQPIQYETIDESRFPVSQPIQYETIDESRFPVSQPIQYETIDESIFPVSQPIQYETIDESRFPVSQSDIYSQPELGIEDDLYSLRKYRDTIFGTRDEFAEGGMTGLMEEAPKQDDSQSLIRMTVSAIRGEVENADQIIKAFVEQYGTEAFMQLREAVLQSIVPGAQTNGMVEGEGGGQDDMVEGMIGDRQRVAVSPGEYIVPADVVSLAGGGYSGDGAKFFDGLVDDIRQKTIGTTEQVKPYRSGV